MTLANTSSENPLNNWAYVIECSLHDKCKYYASDIMQILNLEKEDFYQALEKVEKSLLLLQLPLKYNSKTIYLATQDGLLKDLKLSPIALYFLTIYSSPSNPNIAKLQWYIAQKQGL